MARRRMSNPLALAVLACLIERPMHAVWPRLGFLAALAAMMAWLATRAFRSYQASI